MIRLKYCGSFPDNSGYGDSNRADVVALFCAGIDVVTEHVSQTLYKAPNGWAGSLCAQLEERELDYKVKIIHLTPDLYPNYMEDGKYHIGRLVWETDRLPKEWIGPCNKIQEIWTMTQAQAEVIKASGVTVPIHVFPEPIDVTNAEKKIEPFVIPNFNGVIFYSIFQWIERKDPYSLLTTYWKTFEGKTDVALILKTYRVGYSEGDFEKIKEDVKRWKEGLKQTHYPRVFLIKELWPTEKVWKLHKMGGIYVSTSHGEGWNRGGVEAGLVGNPIIALGKTGFVDELPQDSFFAVAGTHSPVVPQSWISWYQKGQNWLNIDTQMLSEIMLKAYTNQVATQETGKKAQSYIKDHFNYWTVGNAMKQRLEEISRFL